PATSEQGTPAKKSTPAASSASTKRTARPALPLAAEVGPGAAVVIEAVDLHPALVDVHGDHPVPAIDHRLQEVRQARTLEALGTLCRELAVDLLGRLHAGRGEPGDADELAVGIGAIHLGADPPHAASPLGRQEPAPVALRLRDDDIERTRR